MIVNWSRKSLESISSLICSGGTPLVSEKSFYGGDIPWLRTQEIQGAIVWDTEVKITKKGLENSAAKWVAKNSIALAMYGNTAGRVSTVGIDYTSNQACCNLTINPSLADYRFVYYSLLNDYQKLHDLSSGAAQRNLNAGLVRGYEILIPDSVLVQTKIADVLWNLDRKIALNRRKIATLEKMAKEIYDYWFVQYDFPDANGRPYKSSGGEMVYSPELKREIPKGWRVGCLADIALYPQETVRSDAIDIDHYVTTDSLLQEKLGRTQASNLPPVPVSLVAFQKADTLVANIRPYLKKIWYASEDGGCSQDVLVFHPINNELAPLLHSIVWQDAFFDYVMAAAKGSKMPRGDKAHIMAYPILLPDKSVVRRFGEVVEKFYAWRECALKESASLTALRDYLLPLLMNGQVKVG